jgi:hypothetical protein
MKTCCIETLGRLLAALAEHHPWHRTLVSAAAGEDYAVVGPRNAERSAADRRMATGTYAKDVRSSRASVTLDLTILQFIPPTARFSLLHRVVEKKELR